MKHPDEDARFQCMKFNVFMCERCLACPDPDLHCKFRSSCPIWFMVRRGGRHIDADAATGN